MFSVDSKLVSYLPVGLGEWQLLLRLEKLTPARLDDSA